MFFFFLGGVVFHWACCTNNYNFVPICKFDTTIKYLKFVLQHFIYLFLFYCKLNMHNFFKHSDFDVAYFLFLGYACPNAK